MTERNAIESYRELRKLTDGIVESLEAVHMSQLNCSEGCCGCCTNLTVFPVEFNSILGELRDAGVKHLTFDEEKSCGFLDEEDLCSIYPFRPLICRTHGLPIAFIDDENDDQGYSVSFCEDNFLNEGAADIEFSADTTINIEELNDSLFRANLQFLEEQGLKDVLPTARVELKELISLL